MEHSDGSYEYQHVYLVSAPSFVRESSELPSEGTLYLTTKDVVWISESQGHRGPFHVAGETVDGPNTLRVKISDWILNRLSKAQPKIKFEYNGPAEKTHCVFQFSDREVMSRFSNILGDLRKKLALVTLEAVEIVSAVKDVKSSVVGGAEERSKNVNVEEERRAKKQSLLVANERKRKLFETEQESLLQQHRMNVLSHYGPDLMDTHNETVCVLGSISEEAFWKLHEAEDFLNRPLPVSRDNRDGLLASPPVSENFGGGSVNSPEKTMGSQEGVRASSVEVNVTRTHLEQILAEDEKVRMVYRSNVPKNISEKGFWEKFFQSPYFYNMIGKQVPLGETKVSIENRDRSLLESTSTSPGGSHELASLFGNMGSGADEHKLSNRLSDTSVLKEDSFPVFSPFEIKLSQVPYTDLLASEACRLPLGFGSILGYNSFGGELVDDADTVLANGTGYKMAFGSLKRNAKPHIRTLIQRFNNHSNRILSNPAENVHQALIPQETCPEKNTEEQYPFQMEDLYKSPPKPEKILSVTRQEFYAQWAAACFRGGKTDQGPGQSDYQAVLNLVVSDLENIAHPQKNKHKSEKNSYNTNYNKQNDQNYKNNTNDNIHDATFSPSRYGVARAMFVHNTKLCQNGKNGSQANVLSANAASTNGANIKLNRVAELVRHYFASRLPEIDKRTSIVAGLLKVRDEIENDVSLTSSSIDRALLTPILATIKIINAHFEKVNKFINLLKQKAAKAQDLRNQARSKRPHKTNTQPSQP